MPGGEWARRTIPELETTIGTSRERAHRVTGVVRSVINGPERDVIRDEVGESAVKNIFFSNLADSLNNQPGNSAGEKWNNLVEVHRLPEITDEGIYLLDWEVYLAFGGGGSENDGPYHTDTFFRGPDKKAILGRSVLKYGRRGVMEIEKIPGGLLVDGEEFEAVRRLPEIQSDDIHGSNYE